MADARNASNFPKLVMLHVTLWVLALQVFSQTLHREPDYIGMHLVLIMRYDT